MFIDDRVIDWLVKQRKIGVDWNSRATDPCDPREDALPPGLRMAKTEHQPSHLPEDANPFCK